MIFILELNVVAFITLGKNFPNEIYSRQCWIHAVSDINNNLSYFLYIGCGYS